jgi:hypothetical protein
MKHSERGHTRLTRSLQMLAGIEATSEASSRVEKAVMAHWDDMHSPRGRARSRARRVVRAATTAAAGITLVTALIWQRGANAPGAGPAQPEAPRAAQREYTTVAVVGGPLLTDEPIRVVRMRVARSVLGELGIPSAPPRGAAHVETVDIDVLVGEDGVARGVRVPINEL